MFLTSLSSAELLVEGHHEQFLSISMTPNVVHHLTICPTMQFTIRTH